MAAVVLQHYNIRTTRFLETVRFYVEVLGLVRGPFPGKTVPGAWIYDQHGTPVVHIVAINPFDAEVQAKADGATLPRPLVTLAGSGAIDHIAFLANDHENMMLRIKQEELPCRLRQATAELRQIYLVDPNGILIELNFENDGTVT